MLGPAIELGVAKLLAGSSCPMGSPLASLVLIRIIFPPPTPKSADFTLRTWLRKIPLTKGVKVLETAVGAVFAPNRFSLVRISVRDLVADGKSLLRISGVGGGARNRILSVDAGCWGVAGQLCCLRSSHYSARTQVTAGFLYRAGAETPLNV